ncbi:hypothetical protein [Megasphaera elsdenii]|jgi:hypothetical protein|nr:hypothetical protein [Megasphaera elsdenii]
MSEWVVFVLGALAGGCIGCGMMCIFVANSRFCDEPKKEDDTHEQI